jgi:acyl phosphate:glycerol-3-phosphate acyltransferase
VIYHILFAVLIAYLIGAVPFSYILGRLIKGIDIRKQGSGNVGATNLTRCAGKPLGAAAFLLDAAKGFVAVVFVAGILYNQDFTIGYHLYRILLGLACVSGHIWTVFLGFKGGKGVATTIGVLTGLSPIAVILGLMVWVVFIAAFGYVSLSSIAMSLALPVSMFLRGEPVEYVVLSAILCIIIIIKHQSNIIRIITNKEPRTNLWKTDKSI